MAPTRRVEVRGVPQPAVVGVERGEPPVRRLAGGDREQRDGILANQLRAKVDDPPPPRPGVDLLLAMPRPKALRKVLPAAASLGVDRIVLVNAARVEKSYFDSKVLASVEELSMLGLEQARDTILPQVLVRERFRPYVEDELDPMFEGHVRLLAHPAAQERAPQQDGRVVIAIGPEGGWVPFEIDLLQAHGFTPFTLGPRTLRVEVAVPYALGAISRSRINP